MELEISEHDGQAEAEFEAQVHWVMNVAQSFWLSCIKAQFNILSKSSGRFLGAGPEDADGAGEGVEVLGCSTSG